MKLLEKFKPRKKVCPDCKAELSKSAAMCPECNHNFISREKKPFKQLTISNEMCCPGAIILLVLSIYLVWTNPLFQSIVLVFIMIILLSILVLGLVLTGYVYKIKRIFGF